MSEWVNIVKAAREFRPSKIGRELEEDKQHSRRGEEEGDYPLTRGEGSISKPGGSLQKVVGLNWKIRPQENLAKKKTHARNV